MTRLPLHSTYLFNFNGPNSGQESRFSHYGVALAAAGAIVALAVVVSGEPSNSTEAPSGGYVETGVHDDLKHGRGQPLPIQP